MLFSLLSFIAKIIDSLSWRFVIFSLAFFVGVILAGSFAWQIFLLIIFIVGGFLSFFIPLEIILTSASWRTWSTVRDNSGGNLNTPREFLTGFIPDRGKVIILIIAAACLAGFFRREAANYFLVPAELAKFLNTEVVLAGQVRNVPRTYSSGQRFLLSVETINKEKLSHNPAVIVKTRAWPEILRGESWQVACRPYRGKIYVECNYPELKKLNQGNLPLSLAEKIRQSYLFNLRRVYPEPAAGLITGLTAGGLSGLNKDWQDKFRLTGTTHLVALSGFNVSIVANLFMMILSYLCVHRRSRVWIVAVMLGLFCLLVNAEASLIRAAIMGLLVVVAKHIGRPTTARTILAATAALMAFQNPLVVSDIGFWLSFLATAGLLVVLPLLEQFIPAWRRGDFFRQALLMSLSAQIFVLPLLLYAFSMFSTVAPLTNALIAVLIPFVMLFGFIGTLVGFTSPLAGLIIGLPAWLGAEIILAIINFFAGWPLAIHTASFPLSAVLASYAVLIIIIRLIYPVRNNTQSP